jgi:hypothetical protein
LGAPDWPLASRKLRHCPRFKLRHYRLDALRRVL